MTTATDGGRARWPGAAAAAAGLALWAAFPRLSLRPLAFVGVALLLLAVRRRRPLTAAGLGVLAGLTFFVPLLSWLQIGAGTNAWLIVAVLQALYWAPLGAGLAVISRLPGWPVWSAAWWVAIEAVRGRFPLGGFTWGRVGFSQDSGPLLPWAGVGGVALVSFLTVLLAGLVVAALAALVRRRGPFPPAPRRFRAASLAVAAALPLALGPLLPDAPVATGERTVALVQGNVPRLGLAAFEQRMRVLRNHADATLGLAESVRTGGEPVPDFVVWPENSTDIDPRTDAEVTRIIREAVDAIGVPVLVGAVLDRPDDRVENAGVVWEPGAPSFDQRYVKRHLVPYGEYVPLRRLFTPVFGRLALIPRDFVPGGGRSVLDLAGTPVGDVICFEVSYDGLVRDAVRGGAELLVVQTNNATYGRSALTDQQLAMSKFRAVEHGRAVLVTATSGISAVIRPDGRIVERSGIWERDVMVRDVALARGRTLATRTGALPEWLLAVVGLMAVLAGVAVGRRA